MEKAFAVQMVTLLLRAQHLAIFDRYRAWSERMGVSSVTHGRPTPEIQTNLLQDPGDMTSITKHLLGMRKPRLYVALYALDGALRERSTPGPQDYHWAILVAPKVARKDQPLCIRYRIRKGDELEHIGPGNVGFAVVEWASERSLVPLGRHDDIVARVLIAKVVDTEAVGEYMQDAWPEKTMHVRESGRARTSKDWVQRVVETLTGSLQSSTCVTSGKLVNWETVEACCATAAEKAVVGAPEVDDVVPTVDMLKNQESSWKFSRSKK